MAKKRKFKLGNRDEPTQEPMMADNPDTKPRAEAIKYYDNKLAQLKEVRQTYEPIWTQIMDYIAPDLKGYLNIDRKDDGARTDDMIYDGTPAEYARKCAAGMWASISSPSRPWMRNKMRNKAFEEVTEANEWLDAVTELEYDIMQDSNFYQAMYSVYFHLTSVQTACMIADPDYDTVANFTTLNVGEYWLGINGKGKVDTLFRELEYTASQLKDKFGDAVPEHVKRSVTNDNPVGNKYKVIHVIEPDSQGVAPFKKPYASVYYLKNENKGEFLQVRGYNRKPFVSPRWYTNAGETYGKMGPGRNSLGNCMQLQTMVYDFHEALQKVITPPTQGDSSLLDSGMIDTRPGAYNPTNPATSGAKLEPLFAINPDLQSMWQAIQDKKDQIAKDFYIDLFMAVSMRQDKDMTAEEVRSIAGERMLALGPGLDNLHTELLNEVIDIIYDYAVEAGILPEPPEEIQGQEIEVDYVSVLAQAQKMVDISRVDQVLSYVMNIVQVYPDILDKVDLDQVIDEVAKMVGTPSSIIKSDEVVAQLRQAKAQQQQAQQLGQAAMTAADVAGKAGNISMDGSNLASMVLGVNQ
jgi:hypothetical protein